MPEDTNFIDLFSIPSSELPSDVTMSSYSSYPAYDEQKVLKFTKKGLTVIVPSCQYLAPNQKEIVNGLYNWWIENALVLIEKSYGENFGFSDRSSATVQEITIKWVTSKESNLLTTINRSARKSSDLWLGINLGSVE